MKKNVLIIGGVVVVIALTALSGVYNNDDQVGTESGPIEVGGLYILTGPAASSGILQQNATILALEKINADGGINGRELKIVQQDTAFDPKVAVDAYQALKTKGIKYFIADGSPVVAALHTSFVADDVTVITVAATTPVYNDGNERTCRIALTANSFGPAVATMFKQNGYKRVAFLVMNNEYGQGMSMKISESFIAEGGEVVTKEMFDASAGDYRTHILKLIEKEDEIDALFVVNVGSTVESMFTQLNELGWDKPILSDYYTIQGPSLKNISLAEGVTFADYEYSRSERADDSEDTKAFKAEYKKRFGNDPVFIAAATYDAILLLAEGLRQADMNDPSAVAAYVSNLESYKAITGTISFNDDCEVAREVVVRKVVGGKIVE